MSEREQQKSTGVDGAVAGSVGEDAAVAALMPQDRDAGASSSQRSAFVVPPRDDTVAAPRPGGLGYRVVKRAFDIAFSAGVVAVLAVPTAIACAAICADSPGSPIFRQERVGLRGKTIRIFKLRTMVADAHEHPERYMTPEQLERWHREQKLDDDPRVTRVGRFLRNTSLAPVIIGTPGDGEPTKSLSHPENSSLDLQKCERRPGTFLGARHHYTSFQFLSFAVFGGPEGTSGRHLCAFARAPFAAVGTVA